MADRIAFLDLDRTLIGVNSATYWIRREVRLGYVSYRQALWGAGWIMLYQMGFLSMDATLRDAAMTLRGKSEDQLRNRSLIFWEEEIAQRIRPGARRTVEMHRSAGDYLALLTTSSSYLGEAAAETLDLDEVLCNRFEVVEGRFTGKMHEPLCFGEGKLHHAQELAKRLKIPLESCSFYTDSYSDLPVLDQVGQPVVVHPDPRLARIANRRGWPVVNWMQGA